MEVILGLVIYDTMYKRELQKAKMGLPNLSIITVTYRDPQGLESTLNSLRPLVGKVSFESIVVDSSPEMNASVLEKQPFPIMHLTTPPAGIYSAMNMGANAATSQVLWFLNGGDSLVDASALEALLKKFGEENKTIILAGVELWENNRFLRTHQARLPFSLLGINEVCHQGVLYPREAFFDSYMNTFPITADYIHLLKSKNCGFKLKTSPIVFARFHKGGTSDNVLKAVTEFARAHWENPMHSNPLQRATHFIFWAIKAISIFAKRSLKKILQKAS